MSKQNWQRTEGGFVLHGHRLSREEIKIINARLDGHDNRPTKRIIPIPSSILPRNWMPGPESDGASYWIRGSRLDLLQHLGEQMLQATQES